MTEFPPSMHEPEAGIPAQSDHPPAPVAPPAPAATPTPPATRAAPGALAKLISLVISVGLAWALTVAATAWLLRFFLARG